jgi:uncharacterized protein YrrD
MRGREVLKRPVVTLDGEDVAQVKDVVYGGAKGEVVGFTLAGRGLFSGPSKLALPWSAVHALGRDAVMIADEGVLVPRAEVTSAASSDGDVLGDRVVSDGGTHLGKVVDVVLEVGAGRADVVGYELEASAALGTEGRKVLIPLPDTLAVSSEALIVPASAVDFVADDLSGFGAAVGAFRARLEGRG